MLCSGATKLFFAIRIRLACYSMLKDMGLHFHRVQCRYCQKGFHRKRKLAYFSDGTVETLKEKLTNVCVEPKVVELFNKVRSGKG